MSAEDYDIHIQKRSHKDRVIEQQAQRQNGIGNHLVRTTSMVLLNDSHGVDQHINSKSNSSGSSVVHNYAENTDRSRASSLDIPSNPVGTLKLGNEIDFEEICRAITHSIKNECTFRTPQRIAYEMKIFDTLSHHLKAFDSTLRLKIFGSTTYGFGGCNTNLNLLVNTGEKEKSITFARLCGNKLNILIYSISGESNQEAIVALYSFEKFLKDPAIRSGIEVLPSIGGDRVQKRRLHLVHSASGIRCFIRFDSNFELAESSQIIRDCILHDPNCKSI